MLNKKLIKQKVNENKKHLQDIITQNLTHYLETRKILGLHFLAVIFDWFSEPVEVRILKNLHDHLSDETLSPITYNPDTKAFSISKVVEEFISQLTTMLTQLTQSSFKPRASYLEELLITTIDQVKQKITNSSTELDQMQKEAEQQLTAPKKTTAIQAASKQFNKAVLDIGTRFLRPLLPLGAVEMAGVGYIAATSKTSSEVAEKLVETGVKLLVPGGSALLKLSHATSPNLDMNEKNKLRTQAISQEIFKYTGAAIGITLGAAAGPMGVAAGGFLGKHLGEYTGGLVPDLADIRGPIDIWNRLVGARVVEANSQFVSILPTYQRNQFFMDNDAQKVLQPLLDLYLNTEVQLKNLITEMEILNGLEINTEAELDNYQQIRDNLRLRYDAIKKAHVKVRQQTIKEPLTQNKTRVELYVRSLTKSIYITYHTPIITQLNALEIKLEQTRLRIDAEQSQQQESYNPH